MNFSVFFCFSKHFSEIFFFEFPVTRRDAFEDTVLGYKKRLKWYSILKKSHTSQFVLCFWKYWLIHSSSWWTDPEKESAYEMWILANNIPLFTHKNGQEIWPKNEILPNFIQSPNIKYSTYTKTVWGELKGHFELHLTLIWGSEDQKLKNPPPF